MSIKETDSKYVAGTYGRFDVALVSGKGSTAYDENGREYIDFGSGIGVNSFGFSDDKWKNAVEEQLSKLQHASNLYYTEPCAKLAELLCEKTGMKTVFLQTAVQKQTRGQLNLQENILQINTEVTDTQLSHLLIPFTAEQ